MTSKLPSILKLSFNSRAFITQNLQQSHKRLTYVVPRGTKTLTRLSARFYSAEANNSKANDTASAATPQDSGTESETPPGTNTEEFNKLKDELAKLSDISKDFEDKYKRALAETENVRQRMKKQVDDAKQFGIQSFCKDLLSVADTLALASENIPAEQLENAVVKSMHEGLKLTESQLLKVFKDHGVETINPEGEKFDPNFHEALFQQPIPDKEPGTVFVVTKIGYKLNERVLRPAMVGVVKN